jgi:hypothetical protein
MKAAQLALIVRCIDGNVSAADDLPIVSAF